MDVYLEKDLQDFLMEDVEAAQKALYGTSESSCSSSTPVRKVFPPVKAAPDEMDLFLGKEILSPEGKVKDAALIKIYREGKLRTYRRDFTQAEIDLAQAIFNRDPKQKKQHF